MTPQTVTEANMKQETPKKVRAVFTAIDLINAGVGSKNHVYKMLKDGTIPSTELGTKRIVRRG